MAEVDLYIDEMISKIREYGCNNYAVFNAMKKSLRHQFVPFDITLKEAYGDYPIQLGDEQSISQPYTVAFMLDLLDLKKGNNVMEIGTGTGWNASLIRQIIGRSGKVTTLECVKKLSLTADTLLRKMGMDIVVVHSDGSKGFTDNAPYDRIIVTCAAPKIYDSWINQLKEGGLIVVPLGVYYQDMIRAKKTKEGIRIQKHGQFRFVPLKEG